MKTDKLQEFDEDEAKNLLLNFRQMMDIKKYKVPDSSSMWKEDITLNEWLRRFSKRIFYEINPMIGKEFLRILNTIDSQNKLIADRVEEMYRRIMLVAERKDAYIEDLNIRIKELEDLIDAQKQIINNKQTEPEKQQQQNNTDVINKPREQMTKEEKFKDTVRLRRIEMKQFNLIHGNRSSSPPNNNKEQNIEEEQETEENDT